MPEPGASCSKCGAALAGRVCAFCGTLDGTVEGPGDEALATAELHRFLHEAKPEQAVALLLHAFLPTAPAALVDAGTRTLLLLDDVAFTAVGKAAARRLDAITVKLKASDGGPAAERAAKEFEERIARYTAGARADDKSSNRIALVLLVVILGLLGWGAHCASTCGGP